MQTEQPETVTFVPVKFSAKEWDMLITRQVDVHASEAEYIHGVVMRSLRRKPRVKKDVQP